MYWFEDWWSSCLRIIWRRSSWWLLLWVLAFQIKKVCLRDKTCQFLSQSELILELKMVWTMKFAMISVKGVLFSRHLYSTYFTTSLSCSIHYLLLIYKSFIFPTQNQNFIWFGFQQVNKFAFVKLSIAFSSAPDNSKSKMFMFSKILSLVFDLGRTTNPCWIAHLKLIWAIVFWCFSANSIIIWFANKASLCLARGE